MIEIKIRIADDEVLDAEGVKRQGMLCEIDMAVVQASAREKFAGKVIRDAAEAVFKQVVIPRIGGKPENVREAHLRHEFPNGFPKDHPNHPKGGA